MAYPSSGQPKTELLINGTWTDISTRVRGEDRIQITRGRSNEQARVSAQTCNLTINNRDGLYSNRNPLSVNYGLLPVGTQVRVAAGTGDTYLKLAYQDINQSLDSAYVNDKASLDIVGDTEIRVDVQPHTWRPKTTMILASKWATTANQRSWVLYLDASGYVKLNWTTSGALATMVAATSTSPVPASTGRISIKATLDVDNGAAGNTVAFSTSATIGGTYAALGTSVITAGVTSVFSSTAGVTLGIGWDSYGIFTGGIAFGGKFYGMQLYNGIGGTLVISGDFTTRSVGDTTWADSVPSTWNVLNRARITSDRLRFWGEATKFPQVWNKTGVDVYSPVTASGMIRRLTQGASPLASPMYRNFRQYSPNGWWTFEDGFAATQAASAVPGGSAGIATAVTFSGITPPPGAGAAVSFTGPTSKIVAVANATTATTTASYVVYMRINAMPSVGTQGFASVYGTGLVARIDIGLDPTNWQINLYDRAGTLLLNKVTAASNCSPVGQWIGVNVLLDTSGGNVRLSVRWDPIGGTAVGVGPNVATAGTDVGYFNKAILVAFDDVVFEAASFSHQFMSTTNFDLASTVFNNASNAWSGETAVARLRRLATEEAVTIEVTGFAADSEVMGYQTLSTFMDLVYDCVDSDQGILAESRDSLALTYRTRVDLENRHDVAWSYHASVLEDVPVPQPDDTGLLNDVTVTTATGSSARATTATGPKSILAPPNGVGVYDTAVTLNIGTPARLLSVAGWIAFVGSWDDDRYPRIPISMHRTQIVGNATLFAQMMALELGDTATLTGLPAWMPPDDVPLLIQGYTETLWKLTWDIAYNTTQAGPYRLPSAGSDDFVPRADASNTVLNAAVNTTATSIGLKTTTGALWVTTAVDPGAFPFTIKVAGEVMTLTAVVGTTSPQTGTVTRSTNGIVKAQVINAPIYIAQPSYAAL